MFVAEAVSDSNKPVQQARSVTQKPAEIGPQGCVGRSSGIRALSVLWRNHEAFSTSGSLRLQPKTPDVRPAKVEPSKRAVEFVKMDGAGLPIGLRLSRSAMWQRDALLKGLRFEERSFKSHEPIHQANPLSIRGCFQQAVVVQAEYGNAQLVSCSNSPQKQLVMVGWRFEREEMVGNCLGDQMPVRFLNGGTVIKQVKGLLNAVRPAIQLGLDFRSFRIRHFRADVRPKLAGQRIAAAIEK